MALAESEMTKLLLGKKTEEQKPCPNCGSVIFKIEPGVGPHALHLRCDGCDRGGRWWSKQQTQVAAYSEAKHHGL
jgi:hypothetical protein